MKNTNPTDWLPLVQMFSDKHPVLLGAAGEVAMDVSDVEAFLERIATLEAENAELRRDAGALQARLDELMFEYCPDEMTPEQIDNYAKHQRPASAEEEAAVNAAMKENGNG